MKTKKVANITESKEFLMNLYKVTKNEVCLEIINRLELDYNLARDAVNLWKEQPPTEGSGGWGGITLTEKLVAYRKKHLDLLKAIKEWSKKLDN